LNTLAAVQLNTSIQQSIQYTLIETRLVKTVTGKLVNQFPTGNRFSEHINPQILNIMRICVCKWLYLPSA